MSVSRRGGLSSSSSSSSNSRPPLRTLEARVSPPPLTPPSRRPPDRAAKRRRLATADSAPDRRGQKYPAGWCTAGADDDADGDRDEDGDGVNIQATTITGTTAADERAGGDVAVDAGHSLLATASLLPRPAAVEAGQAKVRDHLRYFASVLAQATRQPAQQQLNGSGVERSIGSETALPSEGFARLGKTVPFMAPTARLPIEQFEELYLRNAGSRHGRHFVIHQHDHPRAGLHYDLRLQVNEDSSCSWAIPYGLPGNPCERRHGRRQAVETRVHPLWNHLCESASHQTGSILIWDTGEYEVLPFDKTTTPMTDDESSSCAFATPRRSAGRTHHSEVSETEKLCAALRTGRVRLRLRGSQLPKGYTISMSLCSRKVGKRPLGRSNQAPSSLRQREQRQQQWQGRRAKELSRPARPDMTFESDDVPDSQKLTSLDPDSASEDDVEIAAIRATNAYPGARNTVGSVQQRRWVVSMDKEACGFLRARGTDGRVLWSPSDDETRRSYPFLVQGRDVERSVVTNRMARDVLEDEGVEKYVPRRGWRAILN